MGGGFLKNDSATGLWFQVGDSMARLKTSQAFRDALEDNYLSSNSSKKKRRRLITNNNNNNNTAVATDVVSNKHQYQKNNDFILYSKEQTMISGHNEDFVIPPTDSDEFDAAFYNSDLLSNVTSNADQIYYNNTTDSFFQSESYNKNKEMEY